MRAAPRVWNLFQSLPISPQIGETIFSIVLYELQRFGDRERYRGIEMGREPAYMFPRLLSLYQSLSLSNSDPILFFRIAIFGVLLSSRLTSVHTTMLSNESEGTTSRTASFIYVTQFPLCLARRYIKLLLSPFHQAVTIVCMRKPHASSTHFRLFYHSVPSYTSLNFIIPSRLLAHEAVHSDIILPLTLFAFAFLNVVGRVSGKADMISSR